MRILRKVLTGEMYSQYARQKTRLNRGRMGFLSAHYCGNPVTGQVEIEKKSRYVTLPCEQNFWMTTSEFALFQTLSINLVLCSRT